MNKKQKTCLWVGIAVIVVMGLFPPWVLETKELWAGKVKYTLEPGPYSWIGNPPVRDRVEGNPGIGGLYATKEVLAARARFIDLYRLGVQYFVVAVVTAGLVITFRDEKATKQ